MKRILLIIFGFFVCPSITIIINIPTLIISIIYAKNTGDFKIPVAIGFGIICMFIIIIMGIRKITNKNLKYEICVTPEIADELEKLDRQANEIMKDLPTYKPVSADSIDTSISDEDLEKMVQKTINDLNK